MDIRLEALAIGYGNRHIVAQGIDATIEEGKLTCLIGGNGIGKSTLLRTISGLLPKQGGHIWLADRDIDSLSAHERALTVSIVSTQRPGAEALNVHDLVGIGRSPYTNFWGKLSPKDETAVSRSLSQVGATPLAQRRMSSLSDGEAQKVMIARALAQETPIILLDEPTAFLDFGARIDTLRLLSRLAHDTGKTILMSTHDLELATELADNLLLLSANGLKSTSKESVRQNIRERLHAHETPSENS